jgi:hypothetical protein
MVLQYSKSMASEGVFLSQGSKRPVTIGVGVGLQLAMLKHASVSFE